jgi:hypothetical protein
MADSKLNQIKMRIKTILDALHREEILADVQVDDFKRGVFDRKFSNFPVAVLTTASIESRAETNVHNTRTYQFEIMVLSKTEDVSDPAQIEDLIENILNKFDNDPTLKAGELVGVADAGVEPSTSTPEAFSDGSNNYIAFSVFIRVKAIRDLTFV